MSLFDLFTKFKQPVEESEEKKLEPFDRPYEWFSSEYGLKAFEEYTQPKCYLLEETIKKDDYYHDSIDRRGISYVARTLVRKGKIPSTYFEEFIKSIHFDEALPEYFVIYLKAIAKSYELDEDGEPVPKERMLPPESIVNIEKNPILFYFKNFKVFRICGDPIGTFEERIKLYKEALIFILNNISPDNNIVKENMWLLEKSTYINTVGTLKTLKGFYKVGAEKSTNKEYFLNKLEELE